MPGSDYTRNYYEEVAAAAAGIDQEAVDRMIDLLIEAPSRGGRLFIVGGGVGHAGHAVNDFRKICGIESYAPTAADRERPGSEMRADGAGRQSTERRRQSYSTRPNPQPAC